MKNSLLVFILLVFASVAKAQIRLAPYCYSGTMKTENGQIKDVFLQFKSAEGSNYQVATFTLGDFVLGSNGTEIEKDRIVFNSNDDYIPGGNASFNLDVDLTFKGKNVEGTFKYYRYEVDGPGGFGSAQRAGVRPVETAELKLRRCKTVVSVE
jgi:hypothetical protein